MSPTGQEEFEFGPFRLDGRRRSLTRDGIPVPVGGRALDVLLALAAAAGETVGKTALLDHVWPGLTVEENNLQVHISADRPRRWRSALCRPSCRAVGGGPSVAGAPLDRRAGVHQHEWEP